MRRRILIIEDNHDTADSLAMLLRLLGHDVHVAYNGADGVEAARQYAPSAVLSDIGLPGLDGWAVARQLRADPTTAGTLLIAITAYGGDETRRRAAESGFDHVFIKPADPAALLRLFTG
jgi:CheY-like chemotaxis protein